MASRLTDAQQTQYKEQGYLLYNEPVLKPEKFESLAAHFEKKVATFEQETGRSPEHMDVPHFTDPKLFDWLFDDDVLDLVESLIGPDIVLFSSHFICKPAGRGKRVPWHEDSSYWGNRLEPMEVVTLWLAIDPATPENGCMRVIPGTHENGYSEYAPVDSSTNVFATEIKQESIDESKAVDCILQPNECSFHHAKLIHGSNPNNSDIRRCGYTMRYISAACKHNGEGDARSEAFQVYLARGEDKAGNHYGDPNSVNEKWLAATTG